MFENVIVGVKDRVAGRDALELARRLVSPEGTLLLVNVHDTVLWPFPVSDPQWQERERRRALEQLGPLRAEAGVDAQLLSVQALTVAAGLHEVARERGDLLAIGASRGDEFDRALVSDDARALLEDAPCAIAVAPVGYAADAPALRKIGVAFDGSHGSEEALAAGRTLAGRLGAELSAFAVVPEPLRIQHPLDMDREIADLVAEARKQLAELPDVRADAGYGDAAEELARYGASVDLLILGPHEQRWADRLWGGSTAQRVSTGASCPVLVLGPAQPATERHARISAPSSATRAAASSSASRAST
jgi:nucleotide-binding universal stress UspA family protein